jgi:hypothetical protein
MTGIFCILLVDLCGVDRQALGRDHLAPEVNVVPYWPRALDTTDTHLLLQDKAGPEHQLLFDNRDDQNTVLFARLRNGLDNASHRNALDFHSVAAQHALHNLALRLDMLMDKHPVGLHLPRANHDPLL